MHGRTTPQYFHLKIISLSQDPWAEPGCPPFPVGAAGAEVIEATVLPDLPRVPSGFYVGETCEYQSGAG